MFSADLNDKQGTAVTCYTLIAQTNIKTGQHHSIRIKYIQQKNKAAL